MRLHTMKMTSRFLLAALILVLYGCSEQAVISGSFELSKGASMVLHTDVNVAYTHSGVYFDLIGVSDSKQDRDFADFMSLELLDGKGNAFRPQKIWDINGNKRNIVAFCDNIPTGTNIKTIRVVAHQDLKGTKIRWWTGHLK